MNLYHTTDAADVILAEGFRDGEGNYGLYDSEGRPFTLRGVFVADEPVDNTNPQPAKSPINAKYRDATTTPIQIEVKDGAAPNAYDLTLSK